MPTTLRHPKGPITEDPRTGRRVPVPKALEQLEPLWTDERKELIAVYAKDCLNRQKNGREVPDSSAATAFWGDPDIPSAQYRRLGYEPVVDPETKEQVTHRGDPLFRRARELTKKALDLPARHSAAMVEDAALAKEGEQTKEGFFVPREESP